MIWARFREQLLYQDGMHYGLTKIIQEIDKVRNAFKENFLVLLREKSCIVAAW